MTPPWLRDLVHGFATIALDVCTEPENPMDALACYVEPGRHSSVRYEHIRAVDGLSQDWAPIVPRGTIAWCNPPYSLGQVIRWAKKAVAEADAGADVVMLTQADVSTKWFHFLRTHADSVCLLGRRVGFITPGGSQMPGAKFGSALWYLGSRTKSFRNHFCEYGWVVSCEGR